jgi:hypothetical protein
MEDLSMHLISADDGTYVMVAFYLAVSFALGGVLAWKMGAGRGRHPQYPLSTHIWCAIFLAIGFAIGWCVAAPHPEERALLRKLEADGKLQRGKP